MYSIKSAVNFFLTCILTGAKTPANLTAVYKSATSILLAWTYASSTQTTIGYRYVVYYEYAGESVRHNVSVSRGMYTHILTGLSIGRVHNISIVAMIHLPSDVVGPVDPGSYVIYI